METIIAFFTSIYNKIIAIIISMLFSLPLPANIYNAPKGETLDVKIMTYNVYIAGAGDSSPENRTESVVKTIRSEMPDSFGLQEADYAWVTRISEALPEYAYVGVGRDDGENGGEFSPVFYLKAKFNLIDSGTFWLSKTPEKPSRGWDAMLKRICSWAVLEDKESGKRYAHFNAHMDHIGSNARKNSAELIVEKANAVGDIPVVVTGDFNCDEGTKPYNAMRAGGFNDTKRIAKSTMDIGTYHNFGMNDVYNGRSPIDYIFVSDGDAYVESYKVLDGKVDGKYSSDHYPVVSEMSLCYEQLEEQLRVMSYNLRFKEPIKRIKDLTAVIADVSPDIIGTQEATPEWMQYLNMGFEGVYDYIGVGRDNGSDEGEYAAIFYKPDKFNVLDSGTFWLSLTPDVPSSNWDSACYRICTWAVFERKSDGKTFAFLNTHLDHVSEEAQINQAKIVVEKAQSFDIPVIITGDMNVTPDSSVYSTYTDAGYADTRVTAPVTDNSPTYTDFEKVTPDMPILDYIFTDGFTAHKFDAYESYASDHFAVWAELEFNGAAQ